MNNEDILSLVTRQDEIQHLVFDDNEDYCGKTLKEHIVNASNMIHKNSLRGPATHIAANSSWSTMIDNIANMDFDTFKETKRWKVVGLDEIPKNEIYLFREADGFEYICKKSTGPDKTTELPEIELITDMKFPKGSIKFFSRLVFNHLNKEHNG